MTATWIISNEPTQGSGPQLYWNTKRREWAWREDATEFTDRERELQVLPAGGQWDNSTEHKRLHQEKCKRMVEVSLLLSNAVTIYPQGSDSLEFYHGNRRYQVKEIE